MSGIRKNEIDMTTGALLPKILLFACPMIISGILQLLFNAADMVVVGRFGGSDALAAVGSNGPVINLFLNLFMGLSTATSVLSSLYIGAKNERGQSDVTHTAVLSSFFLGVFVGVIGIIFCRPLLIFMGCPEIVIDSAALYLRIYFAGSPLILLYNYGGAVIRATGDTKRPMVYLVISGIVNIALNLFFVIVFKMYVSGVAIATVISQGVSAALTILRLCRIEGGCRLYVKKLRISRYVFEKMIKLGVPAGIQGVVFSLSNVVIQSSINSFGAAAMAGNAAAGSIEGFVYISMNAFHHTALNFAGQNMGAGQFKRLNRILCICIGLVFVISAAESAVILLFREPLISIYIPGQREALEVGCLRFGYILSLYFLCGFMEVIVGVLRGMGSAIVPTVISILGSCVARIIWVYTVFASVGTLASLYVSYPITWIMMIAALAVAYGYIYRRVLSGHR